MNVVKNGLVLMFLLGFWTASNAQYGHYKGQKTIGAFGGVSGSGTLIGGSTSIYLKQKLSVALDGGLEVVKQAEIEKRNLFFDLGMQLAVIENQGKFYGMLKAGVSFSRDEITEPKELETELGKKGFFGGLRVEYFITEKIFLHGQYLEKLFLEKQFGSARRGVSAGVNFTF